MLPVRPHGDAFHGCVALMCLDCYHAWRHNVGWDGPAPACPCCREVVHRADVPPDPVLATLLTEERVQCPHCDLECDGASLVDHRQSCAPLVVRWLRDGHNPLAGTPDAPFFCLRRPGRHGTALACARAPWAPCQFAPTLLTFLRRDEAVAWEYCGELFHILAGRGDHYLQSHLIPALRDLLTLGCREASLRGPLLRCWAEAHATQPICAPVDLLVAFHQLTGPSPELAAATLRTYQRACLEQPWDGDAVRALTGTSCLDLLGTLTGVLLGAPVAHALRWLPRPPTVHSLACIELWLFLVRHRLVDPVLVWNEEDWARWWQAANSGQQAEAVVLVEDDRLPIGRWWAEVPCGMNARGPLDPVDGPFTWWHARANSRYVIPHNPTLWLQQHMGPPQRVGTQTVNLLAFALLSSTTTATDAEEALAIAVRSSCVVAMLQGRQGLDPAVAIPPATVVPATAARAVVLAARLDAEMLFARMQAEHTLMCVHRSMSSHGGPAWPASYQGREW